MQMVIGCHPQTFREEKVSNTEQLSQPSGLKLKPHAYTIRQRSGRTFTKTAVMEQIYKE